MVKRGDVIVIQSTPSGESRFFSLHKAHLERQGAIAAGIKLAILGKNQENSNAFTIKGLVNSHRLL